MPYVARKLKPDKKGRAWGIVNKNTGKVAGRAKTKKDASISASYRNRGHK